MAIEMNDVIITRFSVKYLFQPGKGGRPHHVNLDWQPFIVDLIYERTGKSMVAHVPIAIGTGDDQEDINAIAGYIFRQG